MQTLQITEKNAIAAYGKGTKEHKALLISLFGEDVFNRKITDVIKTFEDALEYSSLTKEQFDVLYGTSPQSQAFGMLHLIAEALNEGWKPNWDDDDQIKYYPWFDLSDPFSFRSVDLISQGSAVGSRLCFKSSDLAEYAGTQFLDIYKSFMTL